MRKLLSILSLAMLMAAQTMAASVSETSAQTVALNFYKSNVAGAASSTLNAVLNFTQTGTDGTVYFYVFDITPGKGFVIVSADDVMEPVIAYSSESNFNPNGSKVGVSDWMKTVSQRISTIISAQLAATTEITNLWQIYTQGVQAINDRASAVGPLVTTSWNQYPYYNMYCPYNATNNDTCVTGCVATAMSQIMKYWNYPATGTGSYSYTDGSYGALSSNFGATTYNWASMPNSISTFNTYIGTLMYQAGVSVAMSYGDVSQGGSGAWVFQSEAGTGNPCAQQAYAKYFSYNASTLQGLHQSSYTASAWITLIDNELNAGRPVEYEGWAKQGGHTWVCDGYEANNMFHMNWGWGGVDNGFYSLSDLNPSPYVFSSDDGALIGIEPLTAATCSVPSGMTTTNVTTTTATFNWSAVSGAASYNVQYRIVGTTTWSTGSSTTNLYNATSLTAGSNYEWQVATVCSGSSSSAFTASTDFSTGSVATCGVPSGMSTSNITTTAATFNWGAVSGAASYNVQYRIVGTTTWSTGTSATNSYNATNLTAGSNYEWQVATVCSGTSSSAFTASTDFSTSSVPTCGVPSGLGAGSITASGATLTWGAVSGVSSYTLEWKASSASTWTTVSSLSTNSYPVSGLASCTAYQFNVLTVCSGGSSAYSSTYSFTTTGCTINYCASKATSTYYEYINNVTLGTINNTSGDNGGYANFTSLSTNLAGGSTYTISLTPGFHHGAYREYFNVWIDYNQNGEFTDAGELVAQGSGSSTFSLSFTVPTTALNGATRMRVQMQYGAYASNSCLTYTYGEVEDYTVNITGNATLHMMPVASGEVAGISAMTLYPNPANDNLNVQFVSGNGGDAVVTLYDVIGKKVLTQGFAFGEGSNLLHINTADLNRGIYIFEIETTGGELQRQKFMINR